MPVRDKIATWLGEKFTGGHTWDGRVGECRTMPTEDYYRARDAADALFVHLVDGIDWPRVVLEAMSRHGALEDAGVHPTVRNGWLHERLCPDCIREALLAKDRMIDWVSDGKPTPAAPAPDVADYARVLGEALKFRQQ